ncbi:hypothetical protein GJV85_10305 [Sulfurimonas aquatica]|uniref:Hemerythrin-like domain-containing protein n=1 Tax=Sulfurimonas aquatica TaxID=2672570 RepID=A0A975B1F9_9BACT|nr:hemerythrin domain-containing protein [Sulfurimonas aquatica]QSZ42484.1 hypothetical protein GJV85_10305 [Sulfurimonas aquatica]
MFEWKKEYELGHLMLDKEHQELFKIANEAFCVVEPSQKEQKMSSLIQRLSDYFEIHMMHEEDFMDSIGYPGLQNEKKSHDKIKKDFQEWRENHKHKSISTLERELAFNIENTIITHIKFEDMKMRHWCEKYHIDIKGVRWHDTYLLGNDLIDKEHKHLFEIANEAFRYVPAHQRKEKIKNIIHELYKYVIEHFSNEEKYMESINYPALKEHIVIHENIKIKMNEFIKKFSLLSLKEIEDNLALFIEEWVVLHVIHEDSKIAKWELNNK